jgi:quercetin dioxygenase-like cupin family protein
MLDEALKISTLHTRYADFPWVPAEPGMEVRVIQVRPSDSLISIQFRAQPGARTGLHRHQGLVFGITTKGAWGHDPAKFPYLPGSYVCEPIGELHRFHNGPDISEVYYISIGYQENIDEVTGEPISRSNPAASLERYLARCEELGFARPNVLP